jgi:hypothetical protein
LHERLDAQREQIATVEKNLSSQISREVHDITDNIRDALIPKLAEHDDQIAELQEAAGLNPRQ